MSMDADIPLLLSLVFIVGGLYTLARSADMFIGAASVIARYFGVSPLIVGMVVIGFGTSAPELAVSAISGVSGHSNLSLGNAYGSCIFNIGAILGVTAIIWPIRVKTSVNWIAVPMLLAVTAISAWLVGDGDFERSNGISLLVAFAVLLPVYCWYDQKKGRGATAKEKGANGQQPWPPVENARIGHEWLRLFAGLALLVLSSHVLVWGSVDFARDVLHVSDLMIGLTVVAVGTSLPELASAIASARKGESEFVVGNIVGSNFFNTLAVVGMAGTIAPVSDFSRYIIRRDLPMMFALTLLVALFGVNWRNLREPGCIGRWKGVALVAVFLVYFAVMVAQEMGWT